MEGVMEDQVNVILSIFKLDIPLRAILYQLNVAKARKGEVKSIVFNLAAIRQY